MTDLQLSPEDIRLLAELERRMDRGEQPFVVSRGHRMAVMPEVMTELGLESGQTVSDFLQMQILKAQIAVCQAQIAVDAVSGETADG